MDYFCPNDGSYMRTATMTLETTGTALVFQCGSCGYTREATEADTKVYSRDYSNAPLVEQIKHNRYLLMDPTLPRVLDVVCSNPDCLTRRKETGLVVYAHNNADMTETELKSIVEQIPGYKSHWYIGLTRIAVKITGETPPEAIKIGGRLIKAEEYKTPRQESVMIKYDSANMKYLYKCCCCGENRE